MDLSERARDQRVKKKNKKKLKKTLDKQKTLWYNKDRKKRTTLLKTRKAKTMMEKMTYVQALNFAIENLSDAAVVDRLTALRGQIEKRNSAERKPTKTQRENAELSEVVLAALDETPCTVSELMKRDAILGNLSNQKVSALVNALVRDGKAVKTADKRVNKFARA